MGAVEVIRINLATKIPSPSQAARRSAWAENDRIRSEASRNLVEAALAAGAGRFVQESIAFIYPDCGDRWIDEDVPLDPPVIGRANQAAEAQAGRFAEAGRYPDAGAGWRAMVAEMHADK